MNTGYFFTYDINTSRIGDNIAVFRYTDLPAYIRGNFPMSPQYPISVVFTPSTIKFLLHYCVYRTTTIVKDEKGKDIEFYKFYHKLETSLDSEEIKTMKLMHMEETLFELPFANDTDSLTSKLKGLYSTRFPIPLHEDKIDETNIDEDEKSQEEYSSANYMRYLLRCRYEVEESGTLTIINKEKAREKYEKARKAKEPSWDELDDEKKKELARQNIDSIFKQYSDSLAYFREADKVRNCYSSLKVWGLQNQENLYELYYYPKKDKTNQDTKRAYNKFLRKVFLDFLFDLEHSEVFENSAYFNSMYAGLNANFFFSAILRKSEFYYQRTLVSEVYGSDEKRKTNIYKGRDAEDYTIYADALDRAEKEWLACIQSPEADKHFYFVPNWYEKMPNWKEQIRYNWHNAVPIDFRVRSSSWFADSEEELHRVLFNYCYYKRRDYNEKWYKTSFNEICNSRWLANLLGKGVSKELEHRQKQTSQWLLKRYNFRDALRLAFFNGANGCWIFILTIFVISLTLALPTTVKFCETLIRNTSSIIYIGLLLLFIFIFVSYDLKIKRKQLSWFIQQKRRINKLKAIYFKDIIGIKYGRKKILLRNILITTILCLIGVCCWINSLNIYWLWKIACVLGLIGIVVWSTRILQIKIGIKILPTFTNYVHLCFPRLIASIVAAWLTIAFSGDLFKAFFDITWSGIYSTLIILLLLVFVYYEVNKILPYKNTLSKLGRTIELLLISFTISLVVGLCVINFTGERLLERSGVLPEFYRENVLLSTGLDVVENDTTRVLNINFTNINKDSVLGNYATIINQYTFTSADSLFDEVEAQNAIVVFADTRYEEEYLERIAKINKQRCNLNDSAQNIDSIIQGKFLVRHENDALFKDLLQYVEHHTAKDKHSIATFVPIGEDYKFFVLWDFLIQFAFVAMFIGIFVQMIFEEKNLTES